MSVPPASNRCSTASRTARARRRRRSVAAPKEHAVQQAHAAGRPQLLLRARSGPAAVCGVGPAWAASRRAAGRCMVGSRRASADARAVIQTKRVLGEEAFILKAVPARTLALRSHSPSFVPHCWRWFSCRTDRALKRRDPRRRAFGSREERRAPAEKRSFGRSGSGRCGLLLGGPAARKSVLRRRGSLRTRGEKAYAAHGRRCRPPELIGTACRSWHRSLRAAWRRVGLYCVAWITMQWS